MSVLVLPVHRYDHVRGDLSAPVKLVHYGDYECHLSGQAYSVVKAIEDTLGKLVCSIYRNFPQVGQHPQAQFAAEAAEAASVQGKFWPMHDLLFEHQYQLAPPFLRKYAHMIELDMHEFDVDLMTHRLAEQVRHDMHSGVLSGVTRTPTFFVNGQLHQGPCDYGSLSRAIYAAAEASPLHV